MARVEQIGVRSWRVRYPDREGRTQSVSGFADRRAANDYAAVLEQKQWRGVWTDPAAGRITVQAWVRRWLPTLTVAERTEENYRRDLRNHILTRWGDCNLADITGGDVAAWSAQLLAAGYATATVATLVKLLSRLLTDAVDARLLAENPVHRQPRRGPRVVNPLAARVWATPEQVVQIAENASALGGATMGLLIITAAWTGTRWGEIAGLQRSNLHLDDGEMVIDRYAGALHESGSGMWLGPPKTSAQFGPSPYPPS